MGAKGWPGCTSRSDIDVSDDANASCHGCCVCALHRARHHERRSTRAGRICMRNVVREREGERERERERCRDTQTLGGRHAQ
jgi:hypothetical protein